jgi:hypothetical protein
MGICNSKSNIPGHDTDDFCPLRIASIYIDLGESINKKKKICAMIDYFMINYYSYGLDVLCLQGIKSHKILKEIVRAFKVRIEEYNDRYAKSRKDIYLEYFPDIDIREANNDMNWSTSETEYSNFYDKLIITKHTILSKASPALGVRGGEFRTDHINYTTDNEYLKRGDNIMFNRDSDKMYDGYHHVQVANINVDGTYVSIYNIELKSDIKGIKSSKERKDQIFDLKELINQNSEKSKDSRIREFDYGDDTCVAHNRNIHIVTGMFHINEMRNDEFNPEYIRTIKLLGGLDTHRWVMAFRNRYKSEFTNIKFTKDSYTLLISEPMLDNDDLQGKAKKLYQEYKTLITSSIIMRNSVDMNYFTNYPIDTLFMIYKPKIDIIDNNKYKSNSFIRHGMLNHLNNQSKLSTTLTSSGTTSPGTTSPGTTSPGAGTILNRRIKDNKKKRVGKYIDGNENLKKKTKTIRKANATTREESSPICSNAGDDMLVDRYQPPKTDLMELSNFESESEFVSEFVSEFESEFVTESIKKVHTEVRSDDIVKIINTGYRNTSSYNNYGFDTDSYDDAISDMKIMINDQ